MGAGLCVMRYRWFVLRLLPGTVARVCVVGAISG